MKKKNSMYVGMITLVTVASVLITGCSSQTAKNAQTPSTSSTAATTAPKKDPVKLTMWGAVPAESGPQAAVDNWNKLHPEIQVEYVRFVNDDAGNLKLDTALVSGQQVDMYMNYAFNTLEKRVMAGNALDLSSYKDYNIDDKMGSGAAIWKKDGKYYGVPTKKGLSFVWLNKDMLDAKGLPVPTSWSLDDMRDYANKLKGDKVWGVAESDYYFTVPINGSLMKQSLLMTKPDNTSAFDNPFTVKTLQVYSDMMFKDKSIMPHTEQITSKPALDQMFVKGETAMLFSTEQIFRTTNNLKDFPRKFKVAAAPAPSVTKDQTDYMYNGGLGDVLTINSKSKFKDEAWQFIKWYADDGMLPLAKGGRVPSSKDFKADDAVKAMFEGVEDTYDLESVKRVMFGNLPLTLTQLDAKTSSDFQPVYDKVFTQKITPEEGSKELARIHNDNLKAAKK
ncbi:extracellular solute-binding protein [Paenibacillus qinlingensis]|uniref:Multiple sugar transport system substrate-binding protein n=1 Tax=Paenibacillus qinlingensis TaxID=1837343 RepID=A0ABU1NSD6_9BACL|nr:extracellular solute-binding protein [Paenibacillus qinlingensis]MDR6550390.1 multiple sugar transport system substrate-binding protein [Paenibacillus qinlingensis]